jgi:hypothetical protein
VWWRISLYLSRIYHCQMQHALYIGVCTVGRLPKTMIDWPSLQKKKLGGSESLQRLKRVMPDKKHYLLDLFGCLELLLSLMIKLCIGRSAWNIFTVQVCVMTHFALFESNISLPDAPWPIYRCLYCWQTSKTDDRLTLTQKKISWKKKRRVSLFNDRKGSC